MGKAFSRPAPAATPEQQVPRQNNRGPETAPKPASQETTPLTLDLTRDTSPSGPNVSTNGMDLDGSTAAGSIESPTSPRTTKAELSRNPNQRPPFHSAPSESSPTVGELPFRTIMFGEKTAVQVVSDDVREILQGAARGFLGVQDIGNLFSETSWIVEPYEPIVHNRTEIERRRSTISDAKTKRNLDSLLGHLDSLQPGLSQKHAEIESRNCQQVLFHQALLLYPPGRKVYRDDDGQMRAYVIGRTEMITRKKNAILQIQAWYLDFHSSGRSLVPYPEMFELPHFASERPISELELIPDWYMREDTFLNDGLIARGITHWSFREKRHYKEYTGHAWPKASYDSSLRVIVDYSTSSRYSALQSGMSQHDKTSSCATCIGNSIGLHSYPHNPLGQSHMCVNSLSRVSPPPSKDVDHEDSILEFCPPRLWAFSLKFKTWRLALHADFLSNVKPRDPFEHDMYMDPDRKDSLESLVSAYAREFNLVDDWEVQPRKSQGMNVFLVGGTGTGKTLTAECLAEKFAIPLYTVTPGDLGVQASILDRNMQTVLQHARNWKAIVLFDDADVYVAGRNAHSLDRVALLPTFLRHLEASDCLSFISVSPEEPSRDIDPGVTSRMHAEFYFDDFGFESQQKIWKMALNRLDTKELENKATLIYFIEKTLRTLDGGAHTSLNGRQINNYLDVAIVMARNDSSTNSPRKLRPEHITTVLRISKDFRDHVTQTDEYSTSGRDIRIPYH